MPRIVCLRARDSPVHIRLEDIVDLYPYRYNLHRQLTVGLLEKISSQAFAVRVLGSFTLFLLLQQGGYLLIPFVQLVFALAIAVPLEVSQALLLKLYPAEDRQTGYSLAYNIGLGVVGGTTPMMGTGSSNPRAARLPQLSIWRGFPLCL